MATGPDPDEVGAIGRQLGQYLLGLRDRDVLGLADEGQVLTHDEERAPVAEFQESRVLAVGTKETPTTGGAALKLDRGGEGLATPIHQRCPGQMRSRLRGGEPGLPRPVTFRVVPGRGLAIAIVALAS